MGVRIYYTFTLDESVSGLKRALTDARMDIHQVTISGNVARLTFEMQGNIETITLEETEAPDHPLARLGRVSAVVVTTPNGDGGKILESVLTLAFLRGGG